MEPILHDLRLSETISPFGVGAVVDVRGESLIAPDTSWWNRNQAPEISCERLVTRLGGGILRQPPSHAGRAAKKGGAGGETVSPDDNARAVVPVGERSFARSGPAAPGPGRTATG